MAIRRVVTGFDADGNGTVLFDGPAPAEMALPPEVGATLVDVWRSESLPLGTTDRSDPTEGAFELMPAGSLFRIIDLEPGTSAPMWHTTASVDFNYVASGQATVLVGEEEAEPTEVTLEAGDTFVHRGPATPGSTGAPRCADWCARRWRPPLPPGVEPG